MAANDSTGASVARRPRAAVAVDGTRLPGIVDLEVTSNSLHAPDEFRATLALADLPPAYGWPYWASVDQASVELFAGFIADGQTEADASLASLILGKVDRVEIDALAMVVRISGRDLSAPLFENRTSEKFDNQTSSQIATTLALRRGLIPVVTPTRALAGRFYEIEFARLTREVIEWDVLSYLAREEGFDVFVSGSSLYFQPPSAGSADPYVLTYAASGSPGAASGNFLGLRLERDLILAAGITVVVKSWNCKDYTGFVTSVPAGNGSSSGSSDRSYSCVMPGLKPEQAQRFGQSQYNEINRHERSLSVTLPGDTVLTPQTPLSLEGTGSGFDQTYIIDRIDRRFSFEGGFTMTVHAKNDTPSDGTSS